MIDIKREKCIVWMNNLNFFIYHIYIYITIFLTQNTLNHIAEENMCRKAVDDDCVEDFASNWVYNQRFN